MPQKTRNEGFIGMGIFMLANTIGIAMTLPDYDRSFILLVLAICGIAIRVYFSGMIAEHAIKKGYSHPIYWRIATLISPTVALIAMGIKEWKAKRSEPV